MSDLDTASTSESSVDPAVEAAWAYERLHVGALFGQWAEPSIDAAQVRRGDTVLDVACGTGVCARAAYRRVGPSGAVTGLDVAPGMLTVAGSIEPDVRWVEGVAESMPFDDDEFDAAVCQFGLMFFPDRVAAIGEMLRCVKPGRQVAVAVWESLDRSDAYPLAVELLARRAGQAAADALRAPFVLGDTDQLRSMFEAAGAGSISIDTRTGTANFPSLRSMVEADLRGWLPVMGVYLDDDLIERLLAEAEDVLQHYVQPDGRMAFAAPAHIVTAVAP